MGGDKPTALRKNEVDEIFAQIEKAKGTVRPTVDFAIGEQVRITDGSFMNFTGVVEELDAARGKVKVSVSIFGRFTPVELDNSQVARIED